MSKLWAIAASDNALSAEGDKQPSRSAIAQHFGPTAPTYERDIAALKSLYDQHADSSTIRVKRQLWENLLTAALGEIARSSAQLDDLFVRHTYLSAVIGMVVQASFGGDIRRLAETDTADLLLGRDFRSKTGLQGVVESDFFAWPTEAGGMPLLRTLARRIARFDWQKAPNDVAAILYETVIPPDERRQLGEYYTPDWLARAIVQEVVTDPLNQYVLDPACGSGTFVAEAVSHFIEAANKTSLDPKEVLDPIVARYGRTGVRRYFRADAAFAKPEVYEYLEERRVLYAIRLPSNEVLQWEIAPLLRRPVGRPPKKPIIWYDDRGVGTDRVG